MIDTRNFRRTGLVLALGLATAACAQPQSPPPAQPSGGMSGMGMQGRSMSGMPGMQGHDMSGMNMQQMMAHCAEMRQQMRPGAGPPIEHTEETPAQRVGEQAPTRVTGGQQ